MSDGKGIELELDLLDQRITTLAELGDLTGDLVATASRLAERLPMLGTAPPAVHLATRLREAAGSSGLAGEVKATEREVREYQQMLSEAKRKYQEHEDSSGEDLRAAEESADPGGHTATGRSEAAGRSS
ncbi:hypothetical protein [Prauserella endophytica]|uniref:ESX-1 secretion-associated protein n=1 Tax=Prauserella endophytica TaxID=1592324 RepID=A0ABY2SBR6_9PSEU|nr:hypothetical protein [Prauserella endophytica]PXY29106.1 hypothetical protein BAY59_15880 [Prauserella coralliicola]TKG72794.1 hypothetical protein FCN18_06095 [Prauserella endophytica]